MIYKTFQGKRLSAMGFGAMRLPVIDGDFSRIDTVAASAMVDYAIEQGVNYFDTAWGYHNGQSELFLREALAKHPRESYFLADKFPGYDLANMDKVEPIFEEQLKKCGVDYFDFYLLHNINEMNIDAYLDPKYGIYDYLIKQKENGRIRCLGFSAHGEYAVMKRFLEAYGKSMAFCQIQLNYLDWTFQGAKEKAALLDEWQIPIWVMEPLRGGQLATLPPESAAKLAALRPDETIPAWAFRFIQSLPSVVLSLTGVSNMAQLKENIATYQEEKPVTKEEADVLFTVAGALVAGTTLPCTACRYCTEHCPKELDIPKLIGLYNEHCFTTRNGVGFLAPMMLGTMPEEKRPTACIGCKSCEAVCPQQIGIAAAMVDFSKRVATAGAR